MDEVLKQITKIISSIHDTQSGHSTDILKARYEMLELLKVLQELGVIKTEFIRKENSMNNPAMNPEDQQEIYIKAYPKVKWIKKEDKFIPDGIEGYVPIQVTNSLMIEINKLIDYESAQALVDNPRVAFSVIAKPSYIK